MLNAGKHAEGPFKSLAMSLPCMEYGIVGMACKCSKISKAAVVASQGLTKDSRAFTQKATSLRTRMFHITPGSSDPKTVPFSYRKKGTKIKQFIKLVSPAPI